MIAAIAATVLTADPVTPEVALSTPLLLGIAGASIAVLLVLIIRFTVPAFLALLVVSVAVAVSARLPLESVFTVVATGVGSTMGKVALLIALGAVLGRLIETSGGVQSLADRLTSALGPQRTAVALTAVAFLVAIPVFFEVAVIVLVPVVYAFAKVLGFQPIRFGLPMAGIALAVHVAVPPHPGVVAGAGVFGADIGLVLLISLVACVPLAVVAHLLGRWMTREPLSLSPAVAKQVEEFGTDAPGSGGTSSGGAPGGGSTTTVARTGVQAPPSAGLIVLLVAAPIVQILLGTGLTLVLGEEHPLFGVATFVGTPVFALLVAVALAYFLIPVRRRWPLERTGEVMEGALPPIAAILLVVAAGGVFGEVLRASGIGAALSGVLDTLGLPLIVLAFVITLALRAAQGSATVAIVTTAGLLVESVQAGGYSPLQVALLTVAVGFGSLGLSHVTDAGFWTVTRYFGLSVADGLRTWTVLTTVLGLVGFAVAWAGWVLTGA
ncbi:GntP family transporter [Quadrisphaera sp. INWT6]|uniref:GntP family transporter n=1 Tax=Quadrisphaera sp. INWT6 TaxID=2596917 RepID=UPI001891F837|nr:GntP family transporter [Quadrisphaera sp. INWT6]MBF5081227.1 GntP family transporter [Quadrisphaera sp. INWT6]